MTARHKETFVAIAEALEAGDVDLARELALTALELRSTVDRDGRRRSCPICGDGILRWPGQHDDHGRRFHSAMPARERRSSVRIRPPRRNGAADRTGREQ